MLPDDTLLEIFDFYRLDAMMQPRASGRPWKWHRLAHVCRRWRLIISVSPRRLDLQILCKSGSSIERILASWDILPLIVRFKGHPKTKSLPKNIATALCYPDRVREIDLGLTSTTVGSIVDAIKKPFQTLEYIRITIKDATGSPLLFREGFLGGSAPLLREITLDGINFPFPEIKKVISSTNNLVELNLSRISESCYFSADALVTALSTSAQLRVLKVRFHYPASLPTQSRTSPPLQRTTFPSLVFFNFHGASEYLEEFASWVDFPALRHITIGLFNQVFFEIPQFCRSILLNTIKFPTEVMVIPSAKYVGISIDQKGKHVAWRHCFLGTSCRRLDWQLSFVIQILNQVTPLLSGVRSLIINKPYELPTGEEDVDSTQWLELFQPFAHAREFRAFEQLVPGIVQALVTEDMATGVLPEVTQLSLEGYGKSPAVVEAVEKFVAARKLLGRNVYLSK